MNSKGAFKKCRDDNFAICSLEAEKGWVGVEPEYYSYGLFQYVVLIHINRLMNIHQKRLILRN